MDRPDDALQPAPGERTLVTTWPIARLFGVNVSLHWSVLVMPVAIFLLLPDLPGPESVLFWTVFWTLVGTLVLWSHEMTHVLISRRLGGAGRDIVLTLTGPLSHPVTPGADARVTVLSALGGPFAHAAWFLAVWPIYALGLPEGHVAEPMVLVFLLLDAGLLGLNLLPFYPLDGGRILRGLLTARLGEARATLWTGYVGYAGAVLMGIAGLALLAGGRADGLPWAILLVAAGVANLMSSQRLVFTTQWAAATRRPQPLASDVPDALPVNLVEPPPPSPAPQAASPDELRERIDRLLDRINEVGGIENLSAAEREELDATSELLREERA